MNFLVTLNTYSRFLNPVYFHISEPMKICQVKNNRNIACRCTIKVKGILGFEKPVSGREGET